MSFPGQDQFRAIQAWSDGTTVDVTPAAAWISTNPSVLSVAAGLATAQAGGETLLRAAFQGRLSNLRTILVVPVAPEWNGVYTLTIRSSTCTSLPLELRERTYTAVVEQDGLRLNATVAGIGSFNGRIFNPEVRFSLTRGRQALPALRTIAAAIEPRVSPFRYRRTAYPYGPPALIEVLPDGNRLTIVGDAVTTMSPAGFSGSFSGFLLLEGPDASNLGGCGGPTSFTLLRQS